VDDLPQDEHLPHWHEKDFKVATANHVIRKGLSHMLGDGRLWTTMDEVRSSCSAAPQRSVAQYSRNGPPSGTARYSVPHCTAGRASKVSPRCEHTSRAWDGNGRYEMVG